MRERFVDAEKRRCGDLPGRDPRRERDLDGPMGPGSSVLLVNRCKPLSGEAVGDTDKRRPDPSVDQRDSALDQASCNDIPGLAKAVENGEDLMAGCVAPPASADRLAGDLLCKIRHGPTSRLQHHALLTHPSQRIHSRGFNHRAAAWTMNREEALIVSALQMS